MPRLRSEKELYTVLHDYITKNYNNIFDIFELKIDYDEGHWGLEDGTNGHIDIYLKSKKTFEKYKLFYDRGYGFGCSLNYTFDEILKMTERNIDNNIEKYYNAENDVPDIHEYLYNKFFENK